MTEEKKLVEFKDELKRVTDELQAHGEFRENHDPMQTTKSEDLGVEFSVMGEILTSEVAFKDAILAVEDSSSFMQSAKSFLGKITKRKEVKRQARRHSSYISRQSKTKPAEPRSINIKRQVKEPAKKSPTISKRSRGRGGGCSTCPGSGPSRFSRKG